MPEEVLNDLLGFKGLKIIQRPDMFNFSLDSILLAQFTTLNKKVKNILDIGTGFAPIPLFLSTKTRAKITGVEIQKEVAEIAQKNVALNALDHQITIKHQDIKSLRHSVSPSYFDVITVNPPFFKVREDSKLNQSDYKTIARHEVSLDLKTIFSEATYLLKNKGRLVMVHRAERLTEIIVMLETYNFALKRLQFVYPKVGEDAMTILIEASYHGPKGVKILEPFIVHNQDGTYTDKAQAIFNNDLKG